MKSFEGISFLWAIALMAGLAAIFSLRALLAWLSVRRDARADFDYKRTQGMVPDAMDRDNYEKIYARVYGPRGPIHVAGAMLAILILTPVAMVVFEFVFNLLYNLSGQNRAIEPGFLVWQFFLFLA